MYILNYKGKKVYTHSRQNTTERDLASARIEEAKILEDGIGYIKLIEFRESTPKDMEIALDSLKKENMNALIVDLRNNPGGLLETAVKVTEKFIPKGKMVVYTKGRRSGQNMEFISQSQNGVLDLPMAVLINEGSASGSEIVAGCLQDYNRAIIIGTKSFGKGSVQTIIPLSDGSALRLTTSKYFTPLGKEIHGKGVLPDILVEEGKIELASLKDQELEKSKDVFEQVEKKDEKQPADKEKDYKTDNQLMRAVDVLKAIKIYKDKK